VHDDSGDWGYRDEGQIEQDGTTLWFDSQISEISYQGEVDGTEVRILYDWCANGVPDVQLVFGDGVYGGKSARRDETVAPGGSAPCLLGLGLPAQGGPCPLCAGSNEQSYWVQAGEAAP